MTVYQDYGYTNSNACHAFNYMLQPLLSLLNQTDNRHILDLGCGNGYLVNYLIEQGYNAYGTDASEKGIAIANNTNPGRFFVQDLSSDALPPQLQGISFDTVISTEVIEHLYNPETFITFCRQQLKPGGQLIVTTPYHGYLKNLLLSIFNKWDTHMNPLWAGGHIKLWSRKTLTNALTQAGFKVVSFKGCGNIPYCWKSMIIKATLN